MIDSRLRGNDKLNTHEIATAAFGGLAMTNVGWGLTHRFQ